SRDAQADQGSAAPVLARIPERLPEGGIHPARRLSRRRARGLAFRRPGGFSLRHPERAHRGRRPATACQWLPVRERRGEYALDAGGGRVVRARAHPLRSGQGGQCRRGGDQPARNEPEREHAARELRAGRPALARHHARHLSSLQRDGHRVRPGGQPGPRGEYRRVPAGRRCHAPAGRGLRIRELEMNAKAKPRIIVSSLDAERLEDLIDSLHGTAIPGKDQLAAELERADVVDPKDVPPTVVTMNSTVRFKVENSGEEFQLTLVYPKDVDSSGGSISVLAPVGSALLGLSQGEEIEWPK